jgi:TctA family transporter
MMQGAGTRLRQIAPEGADEAGLEGYVPDENASPQTTLDGRYAAQRQAAGVALQIALRSLSQKAVVAFASLFSLLLAGSVFWIFLTILPAPTILQLVGAGMFCVFVLTLHLVRRR